MDNVSVKILKIINSYIAPVFSVLINQTFHEGKYPNCSKSAKVIPIFKAVFKVLPGNYRPISNLLIVKVVYRYLYNFLLNSISKTI